VATDIKIQGPKFFLQKNQQGDLGPRLALLRCHSIPGVKKGVMNSPWCRKWEEEVYWWILMNKKSRLKFLRLQFMDWVNVETMMKKISKCEKKVSGKVMKGGKSQVSEKERQRISIKFQER